MNMSYQSNDGSISFQTTILTELEVKKKTSESMHNASTGKVLESSRPIDPTNTDLIKKNRSDREKSTRMRYHAIMKTKIVKEMLRSGCSITEWSRRHEIPLRNLKRWKDQYLATIREMKGVSGQNHLLGLDNAPCGSILREELTGPSIGFESDGKSTSEGITSNGTFLHVPNLNRSLITREDHIPCSTSMNCNDITPCPDGHYAMPQSNYAYWNALGIMETEMILRNDNIYTGINTLLPIFPFFKSNCLRSQ
ncbi:uncharacterized protein LOC141850193 [Brevipalpus obovatus]|uniref:uncharacterized protein LOC141850193 n=1 Tax=Brevipalpus obovatus TaxID=246614 RepID=UPI003D9DEA99